jgi:glycosyltransferase involved in cell wall biosynthesis
VATRDEGTPPTFSVLMPAYNAEATIASAIGSVLRQTRSDFELIVVDDGSTDATTSRIEPFLRDSRILLISQPNRGPSAARNTAIAAARGKYVSLLDSDDLWLPHYMETMGATLDADANAGVAYIDSAWILENSTGRIRRVRRVEAVTPRAPSNVMQPREFLRDLLARGNYVFVGATIRQSVLDQVGGFRIEVQGVEDYEMWLRIASHGYRFVRCPPRLVIYRVRSGQLSSDRRSMLTTAERVYRIVAEEYDVEDDVRELARQRMREKARRLSTLDSSQSRRTPRRFKRPYEALSRIRNFYFRPPREIRAVLSELLALDDGDHPLARQ